MPKVFISYARDESHGQHLATECQQQLQTAGFEVFRDVVGLKPGDVWYSKLEFELETSDVVVLVVSEKVRRSKWVHNEISMAEEIGLPVIPVFAEAVRSPLWLRHLHALDFVATHNWAVLIETVQSKSTENGEQNSSRQASAELTSGTSDSSTQSTPAITLSSEKSRLHYLRDQCRERSTWANEVDSDEYGVYADLDVLGSGVIQRFRFIQPGTFLMGSPGSEPERGNNEVRHQVTISEPFWLADTACTQAVWEVVMGNNPSQFQDNKNNPVETVNWHDAQECIQALNVVHAGLELQLPSEAQWEYVCRAGSNTPFFFGQNISPEQVNYKGTAPYNRAQEGLFREKTVPVKSLPANAWGLYEMHGNVWEWCQDWYKGYSAESVSDPTGPELGDRRVLRGGSWFDGGWRCRSAYRHGDDPSYRDYDRGFRLARGH